MLKGGRFGWIFVVCSFFFVDFVAFLGGEFEGVFGLVLFFLGGLGFGEVALGCLCKPRAFVLVL